MDLTSSSKEVTFRYAGVTLTCRSDGDRLTGQSTAHHNATDRQLRLLVGLVVFLALGPIVASTYAIVAGHAEAPSILAIVGLVVASIASTRVVLNVRIRSNNWGQSWTDIV